MSGPRKKTLTKAEKEEAEQRFDRLLTSVNDASRHCRNVFLIFLLVGLYIAILVASTTDEMIFLEGAIKAPLLNIDVPVLHFFVAAPALFLIFHFNLLILLEVLARKTEDMDQEIQKIPDEDERRKRRNLVFPFPFTHMRLGHRTEGFVSWAIRIIVVASVVVLPVALLLWAQIGFLRYHSVGITFEHQVLVVLDLYLVWRLWWTIVDPDRDKAGNLIKRGAAGKIWISVSVVLSALVVLTSNLAAVVPGGGIEIFTDHSPILDVVFNRTLELPKGRFVKEPPPELMAALVGEGKSIEDVRREQSSGLSLSGRNFSYADLSGAKLYGADLSNANLEGAKLSGAKLQGADLSSANLQGANLEDTKLQDVVLILANLQGADLSRANLQGASLHLAKLQGAALYFAKLQGAGLSYANLQGADLSGAKLQGADLHFARFQGADLGGAKLQGVDLSDAKLQGADLKRSLLGGVDLTDSDLSYVDLRGASFAKLSAAEGKKLRDDIEKIISGKRTRAKALARIDRAMKGETVIRPKLAEGVIYDLGVDVLSGLPPPMDEAAHMEGLNKILVKIACLDRNTARRIGGRIIFQPEKSPLLAIALLQQDCPAIKAQMEKHKDLVGLAIKTLLEKHKDLLGPAIKALLEKHKDLLREDAASTPPP